MEADPDELLVWLKGDGGGERDLQISALEQLCMLVLMCDNIDRCFEQYQPRLFLPALCDIFSDPLAPTRVLEVTARALTYFLDVSVDCAKKITQHSSAIRSMCAWLQVVDIEDRTNKDLAEQIIKVFERLCSREATSIYEQDGLRCVLDFINNWYSVIHKDSLQSALNVVVKLIGKIDPQNSPTLDQTIESLSKLLLHVDTFVSDNALRCFATLADRFARKTVDPEPLMRYCLKDVLLRSLHYVSKSTGNALTPVSSSTNTTIDNTRTHNVPLSTSNTRGVTTNLSVVTGLLSTLCRGSAKVTHDLLRSDLPDALESALCGGDERCVLDTMRFLDLLIVLLFEGRQALPRPIGTLRASITPSTTTNTTNASIPITNTTTDTTRRSPSSLTATATSTSTSTSTNNGIIPSDRSQQQIIEYIRSRDVQGFINHIEQGNIDVNYTDNVGQTMLNWVAAFGTREMIEYLCRRGADVNRGQRSSSLHYAACFGRPSIVRLLLKYGGNVDLRDEDGRTALDKARERQDEGHQEVVEILQSAHEWTDIRRQDSTIQPNINSSIKTLEQTTTTNEIKGDIEMQPIYLQRLLSIFCQLYQNTMILTIKRNTLRLISKLLHYATIEQINEYLMNNEINILTTLFELLSSILDTNEDDDDTSNLVLLIIKNLFEKDRHLFLEQFQYLGLIWKITSLALSHPITSTSTVTNINSEQQQHQHQQQQQSSLSINILAIDAKEILSHRPYVWNEFNLLRNRECLYIWNNSIAIELSMGSNGWFRFFADNSLSTMYSSGSPETNVDTSENRHDFIDKLQRLKQQVLDCIGHEKNDENIKTIDGEQQQIMIARTIFTSDTSNERTITVGNWTFECNGPTQLRIHNVEGEQITIIEQGQPGFIFESNRGTRHTYHAQTALGNEFSIPWSTIESLNSSSSSSSNSIDPSSNISIAKTSSVPIGKTKQEQMKHRTTELALYIYNEYLKNVTPTNYTRSILNELKSIVNDLNNNLNSNSFERLKKFLLEKTSLSLYELSSSGLVSSLLKIFHGLLDQSSDEINLANERSKLFCSIFLSDEQPQAFQILIRKLISILESIEKLPLFLYDTPSNYGLQIFSKRFRFQLHYQNQQQLFTDRTGKSLKIEPLATVGQLKTFLASMVSKQWYDHSHGHLEFVKRLKYDGRQQFTYVNDFDQNGIFYWIGTNARTASDYTNPNSTGLISVTCSDNNCSSQQLSEMISHTSRTDDDENTNDIHHGFSWIMIDLGLFIIPTHFTLRHSIGGFPHWTRSFLFQISKDGTHFIPCEISLVNDTNSSIATWTIKNNLNENSTGFRYIRIHQKCGRHPVSISGLELYGQVISAVDIRSKPELGRSRSNRDDNRNRSTNSRQTPSYHHSHSISSANTRASKMQSHILRRLASMRTTGITTISSSSTGNSNGSNNNTNNNRSTSSTIDRILFDQMVDLSSIPIDLSTALESDDPERLRMVIQETLSRLTGDTILNENTNLLNLISQRKSVSTPNISNGEPVFSVSSTEQASSAESLISSSRTTDHTIDLMQGFRDQIARQYDALVAQTQLEPTIEEPTTSVWLSSSTEDFLTPIRSNTSNANNWLELGEYNEETFLTSKDEIKDKHDNTLLNTSNDNNNCETRLFTSAQTTPITTTTHSRQSISSTTESVESICAVTEENNKKNATSECSEQRIILLENDMNASVPNLSTTNPNNMTLSNLLTTAQSSPNLTTTTLNVANVVIIDDESMPIEESRSLSEIPLSDQQQKQNDETSDDEDMDDDEHCQLKRAKLNNQQIQPPMDTNEDDEDEDDDEADEEEPEQDENCGLFDEQEEEEYDEQLQEQIHGEQQSVTRRNWDDDFVLKRQFSVLLPAFDGRPGRTNINATQDIPVPTTMTPKQSTLSKQMSTTDVIAASNMTLYIRGPSPQIPGLKEIDIEMDDPDAAIFKYVQQLIRPFPSSQRSERIKRIFEPTYTIVYTEKSKSDTYQSLSSCSTDLDMMSIINENIQQSSTSNIISNDPKDVCTIEDILELLRQLYYLSNTYIQTNPHYYHHSDENFSFDNYFYSKKLNNKLLQQIQDSIVIASSSLPIWTEWLTHSYKFLYPFETRQLYFRTTSFGTSRSIVWLQERRDELIRAARTGGLLRPLGGSTTTTTTTLSSFRVVSNSNENSSTTSNLFVPEFRLGRLKIDRATPIDRERILRDAMNLFHYHAKSKAKLEIQFLNEEGTGDGPTLEFYALIANELQKHSLGLWWHHDDYEHNQTIYVRKLEGLFPIPYTQNDEKLDIICNYFSLIGIYFAKCLLDKYLIDMPLSIGFLKLLCMKSKYKNDSNIWYDGILDLNDLIDIEPSRGKFFQQLYQLIEKRNKILNDINKTNEEKKFLCSQLKIENDQHESVNLEHLCLTFVYSPPSITYGYQSIELIPNGSHIDVTIDNVDQYVKLSLEFIFRDGIRRQMDAFRNGFNQVFSIEHLRCFNPHELKLLLCGNQWPSWTLDDLLNYIEPSHGFTRESAGFTKFLNVMLELDGLERKSVVQFITGCSSLPPGGLANLRPRLAVARKVEADDNSYPSVNTCYHYLKLPDYSNQEILKVRLMTACKERGFYFN